MFIILTPNPIMRTADGCMVLTSLLFALCSMFLIRYSIPFVFCSMLFGFNGFGLIKGSSWYHQGLMKVSWISRWTRVFPMKREKKIRDPKKAENSIARNPISTLFRIPKEQDPIRHFFLIRWLTPKREMDYNGSHLEE
jgi:hypothetical protein